MLSLGSRDAIGGGHPHDRQKRTAGRRLQAGPGNQDHPGLDHEMLSGGVPGLRCKRDCREVY